MEFLEGISLRELLRERKNPLSLEESIKIMRPFLNGLSFAHSNGIIHRDLKPENIFISKKATEEGIIKILDFGIAKGFSKESNGKLLSSLTVDGSILGTPLYMAPEQLMERDLTPTTDVYASGLIFYELLTGSQAIEAHSISSIVFSHLNEIPIQKINELPNIDEQIKKFLKTSLTRETEERFQSAVEMKQFFDKSFPEQGTSEFIKLSNEINKIQTSLIESKFFKKEEIIKDNIDVIKDKNISPQKKSKFL